MYSSADSCPMPKMALSKEDLLKEQKILSISLRLKFQKCHRGTIQRFVTWCRFKYPAYRITEHQVRRCISPKHRWQGELSYQKMLDISRLAIEFFINMEFHLDCIAHLLPKTELDKVRLAL